MLVQITEHPPPVSYPKSRLPRFLPNKLIVKFRSGTKRPQMIKLHQKFQYTEVCYIDDLAISSVQSKQSLEQMMENYCSCSEVEYCEPEIVYQVALAANDPFLPKQYSLQKIQCIEAWNYTQSDEKIKIAILDTGVQLDHPDLASKIVPGYNFIDQNEFPYDTNGHGTHVAGIAAAIANNGIGIAGVAPKAVIQPVKVLTGEGSGSLSTVANGIIWAVNHGAKVINLSLGSPIYSPTLQNAVDYAWNKQVIVVAAAGNVGTWMPNYPAYHPSTISVAATNQFDMKAPFSNFGKWVDVAAPGTNILSTYANSRYAILSGTSMAVPHVSGLAALLASQGKNNRQIRSAILQQCDPIIGTHFFWSYGRVNAARSVRA